MPNVRSAEAQERRALKRAERGRQNACSLREGLRHVRRREKKAALLMRDARFLRRRRCLQLTASFSTSRKRRRQTRRLRRGWRRRSFRGSTTASARHSLLPTRVPARRARHLLYPAPVLRLAVSSS